MPKLQVVRSAEQLDPPIPYIARMSTVVVQVQTIQELEDGRRTINTGPTDPHRGLHVYNFERIDSETWRVYIEPESVSDLSRWRERFSEDRGWYPFDDGNRAGV